MAQGGITIHISNHLSVLLDKLSERFSDGPLSPLEKEVIVVQSQGMRRWVTLELAEKLEQLRMLQSGGIIRVGVVEHASSGIDTPADYAAFVARCRKAG